MLLLCVFSAWLVLCWKSSKQPQGKPSKLSFPAAIRPASRGCLSHGFAFLGGLVFLTERIKGVFSAQTTSRIFLYAVCSASLVDSGIHSQPSQLLEVMAPEWEITTGIHNFENTQEGSNTFLLVLLNLSVWVVHVSPLPKNSCVNQSVPQLFFHGSQPFLVSCWILEGKTCRDRYLSNGSTSANFLQQKSTTPRQYKN